MEPGLQPTFTFPSRHNVANKAWALEDQVNMNLNMIVPPDRAAIDPRTLWEDPRTIPMTLNKQAAMWQGKIPVAEPIYFQKRLAEGLTEVAESQAASVEYERIMAANNCLKRGNMAAAEFVLGRPLTAEEIANQTVTPNKRISEVNGGARHFGRKGAMGAKLPPGPAYNETQERLRKLGSTPFIHALAQSLNISPSEVLKMKSRHGLVSSDDFSFWTKLSDEQQGRVVERFRKDIQEYRGESREESKENDRKAADAMGARPPEDVAREAARHSAVADKAVQAGLPEGLQPVQKIPSQAQASQTEHAAEVTQTTQEVNLDMTDAEELKEEDEKYDFENYKLWSMPPVPNHTPVVSERPEYKTEEEKAAATFNARRRADWAPAAGAGHDMDIDDDDGDDGWVDADDDGDEKYPYDHAPMVDRQLRDMRATHASENAIEDAKEELARERRARDSRVRGRQINADHAATIALIDAEHELRTEAREARDRRIREPHHVPVIDREPDHDRDDRGDDGGDGGGDDADMRSTVLGKRQAHGLSSGRESNRRRLPSVSERLADSAIADARVQLARDNRSRAGWAGLGRQRQVKRRRDAASDDLYFHPARVQRVRGPARSSVSASAPPAAAAAAAAAPPNGPRRSTRVRRQTTFEDTYGGRRQGGSIKGGTVRFVKDPTTGVVRKQVRKSKPHRHHAGVTRAAQSRAATNAFAPAADGYFGSRAVVSGELMRRTGRDALPISAQVQVPETHTFADEPVSRMRKFPNVVESLDTSKIPAPRPLGVPLSRATVDNGEYTEIGAVPKRIKFGRYWVDLPRLNSTSVLALHYKNGGAVPGWAPHAVSDVVRSQLHSAMKGGSVDMKKVSGADAWHLGHIVSHTRANVSMKGGGADENLDPKQRLKVILGEIDAGNDSSALKAQLRTLLIYMERRNMMTASGISDIRRHFL